MKRRPMQPIVWDDGTLRFQENAVVRRLLDAATARGFGLNQLLVERFSPGDLEQFAQLIGYSIAGFGELSYVRPSTLLRVDAAAAKVKK